MSKKLRRVQTIVFANYHTLNSDSDSMILEQISKDGFLDSLDLDGCGRVEIPVSYIKDLLNHAELVVSDEVKQNFLKDIERKQEDEYVFYSLF